MEKENKHQREKIYVLEKDCQSYKGKLKQTEHKLMVSDKENERLENQVKLLTQEVDLLKLNHRVGKIEESKANKKKDKTKRLEKTQLENKDSASDPLDNPQNDLCYDE
jgi:hypothetical protein